MSLAIGALSVEASGLRLTLRVTTAVCATVGPTQKRTSTNAVSSFVMTVSRTKISTAGLRGMFLGSSRAFRTQMDEVWTINENTLLSIRKFNLFQNQNKTRWEHSESLFRNRNKTEECYDSGRFCCRLLHSALGHALYCSGPPIEGRDVGARALYGET